MKKLRTFIYPFLLILISATIFSTNCHARQKRTNFSVLQWNIWQEGTMVHGGYDAIADDIVGLKPDFVTLSEVRNYNGTRFCDRIVESLGSGRCQTLKVSCIGDSITYGTGIEDRDHDSYPVQLQNLLGEGYEVRNFGKPGATLLDHGHRPYREQKEYAEAMAFAGDIAVIHMGANDTDPRNWPNFRDEFVHDYLSLISDVRKANPKAKVYVCKVTPIFHKHRRFSSGTRLWHSQINDLMEDIAAAGNCGLIDLYSPLHAHWDLFPDALHPNPEGAGIIARTVYSAITGDCGGLQLSPLYTDHMILQRDRSLCLEGRANAGEKVCVKIAGQKKSTRASMSGAWSVTLDPMKAQDHLILEIRTDSARKTFHEVAVGEVWLCSGQSNMAFMVKEMEKQNRPDASCADDGLRIFNMKPRWNTSNVTWSKEALEDVRHLDYFTADGWECCDREAIDDFSAIAYHFGKMLRDSLNVPVGLICNAVGGSGIEAWVDRSTLEEKFPAILKDWWANDFLQDWVRGRALKNMGGKNSGYVRHPYEPAYLFEAGIQPLSRYPVKGVIWYQGESNAHNADAHAALFKLFTDSWRNYWGNPEMPIYFTQLSSLSRPSWPWFRDSQRKLAETIKFTGMAVTSDVGDSLNVHPKNKKPVGERLARLALSKSYGHSLIPNGPLVRSAILKGNKVYLSFDFGEGLKPSSGDVLIGFELARYDGIFFPADAKVTTDGRIQLLCPEVRQPTWVRYAWKPYTDANLVNSDGLPASTFRISVEQ